MRKALGFFLLVLLQGATSKPWYLMAIGNTVVMPELPLGTNKVIWKHTEDSPIYSVDCFQKENQTYIFYSYKNSIKRVLKGTQHEDTIVVDQNGPVNSLAVDWIHETIYWSVGPACEIHMSDLEGYNHRIIIHPQMLEPNVTMLSYLVVDPHSNDLFFQEHGAKNKTNQLVRTDLYGHNMKSTITSNKELSFGINAGFDYLYFGVPGEPGVMGKVRITDYDMMDVPELEVVKEEEPFSVRVFGKNSGIFAHDEKTIMSLYKIRFLEGEFKVKLELKFNISSVVPELSQNAKIHDMVRLDTKLPSVDVSASNCLSVSCSFKCIALPTNGATCVCPPGEVLVQGDTICRDDKGLQILSSEAGSMSLWNVNLNKEGHRTPMSIRDGIITTGDYDYKKATFIFHSKDHHMIFSDRRWRYPEPLIGHVDPVSALAVDTVQHHFYWSTLRKVEMASYDGLQRKVILTHAEDGIVDVIDIQVEPYERMLFFVNKGDDGLGKVVRTDLQGEQLSILKTKSCKSVSSISIAVKDRRLYMFCQNGDSSQVLSTTFDFTNAIVHSINEHVNNVSRMAVHGNMLYLANFDQNSTLYEGKIPPWGNITLRALWNKESVTTSLRVFSPLAQMSSYDQKCLDKNCSHGCQVLPANGIVKFGRVECWCPSSHTLSADGHTCIENPITSSTQLPTSSTESSNEGQTQSESTTEATGETSTKDMSSTESSNKDQTQSESTTEATGETSTKDMSSTESSNGATTKKELAESASSSGTK